MEILQDILLGIIVLTSVLAVVLVLLNKGKGGGLSDMFGGGMTQSLNTSGVAQIWCVRSSGTIVRGMPLATTAAAASGST